MARRQPAAADRVNLIRVMDLLQEHITSALCRAVFRRVRTTERQRKWTLDALVRFWLAVILRAPQALSHALLDTLDPREPFLPRIQATPEAFFQRCRDLRPAFFAEVFDRFTARLVEHVPERYAAALAPVQACFTAIVMFDGSRLAAIAHRLKILRHERAVILPGCLLGVYDVARGLCRALYFSADAAASEMTRAKAALVSLTRDMLVVGDRLYCTADFFHALATQQCWGLFRRNRSLSLRRQRRLRKRRHLGGCLEDWIVLAGSGQTGPAQTLRHIRWRRGGTRYDLLTNVLDPTRLEAHEALALYPYRWRIERMYFDLKEVLNLNRIYAANPNAVAMQVYAAGMVYNAMRVAQGEVAAAAGLAPEEISPAKFYPRMAAACQAYVTAQLLAQRIKQLNPHRRLRLPDWSRERWASVPATIILVEPRRGHRRRRRYCKARRQWKSLTHVRGGRKFSELS
jgi:IS4 transposase